MSDDEAILSPPVSADDHVTGPENAPVTLVEYGDFECPHCGRAHPVIEEVLRQRPGEVRFVFRHFPLSQIHPYATHAAEATEAAAAQGAFWPMHDSLYEHQDELDDESLAAHATALGLDSQAVAQALADGTFSEAVREDFMSGVRSGVNGTPTFFINGRRLDGGWDLDSLLYAIDMG